MRGNDRRNDRGRRPRRGRSVQRAREDSLHSSAQRGGKRPHYRETFIDEGQVDMVRILSILKRDHFDGVIIPAHTPQMSGAPPWHAGMAHTIGFIPVKAALESSASVSSTESTHRGR